MILEYYRHCKSMFHDRFSELVLKHAKPIRMEKAESVLPEHIRAYLQIESPEIRQCYKNATTLASVYEEEITYCEGICDAGIGIPLEHAFNAYTDKNGEKHYIDITYEYALNDDTTKNEYILLAEYKFSDIIEDLLKWGVYGEIWKKKALRPNTTIMEEVAGENEKRCKGKKKKR